MRKLWIVLAASAGLVACSAEQASKLQQQASAAIGTAHQVVQDSSAPLGELKQQASAARAGAADRRGQTAGGRGETGGGCAAGQVSAARQHADPVLLCCTVGTELVGAPWPGCAANFTWRRPVSVQPTPLPSLGRGVLLQVLRCFARVG